MIHPRRAGDAQFVGRLRLPVTALLRHPQYLFRRRFRRAA